MKDRRAFTLLELCIALAIVVAIASLVAPSVIGRMAIARGREAQALLDASVAEARATAMREGLAVRVTVQTDADGRARVVHTRLDDQDIGAPPGEPSPQEGATTGYVDAVLPEGCRVLAGEQALAIVESEAADAPGMVDASGVDAPQKPVEVCLLLPDGTAVSPEEALVLVDPDGDTFDIEVALFAGGASFVMRDPEGSSDEDLLAPPPAPRADAPDAVDRGRP